MSISLDEVNRIAKLARLNFTESEKQKLQKEMSDILNYVDQLKNISGKDGTTFGEEDIDPLSLNLMRDDVVEIKEDPEEFLQQAPAREGNFIKVKSVLD